MVCEKLDFEYKSEAGFSAALSATVAISDKNLQYITCTRLTAVIDTQVLTTRPIHQMCVTAVSCSITTPFQKCIEFQCPQMPYFHDISLNCSLNLALICKDFVPTISPNFMWKGAGQPDICII